MLVIYLRTGTLLLDKLPILKNRGNNQWQVIEDARTAEYSLKIEVSSNNLLALLSFKKISDRAPNILEIMQKINSKKLKLDNVKLLQLVFDNIDKLNGFENYVLAKGIPPNHGRDSSYEKFFEDSEKVNFSELKTDNVDYKAVRKIHSVKKDDKLAKHIPASEGVDGLDVYGQTIVSHKGKDNKFAAGKNVRLQEDEMILIAEVDGIPEVVDGLFKVESVFNVEKNVDLNVGHIKFSGDVMVGGDVLDGFTIESEGNVHINGTVGASDIKAKGKIIVHGGIAGKNKGKIVCEELHAKFLNETNVEAQKGVYIYKEIMNSQIFCNGAITALTIIGGRTVVKSQLEVQALGSDQNVETFIEVGVDFEYLKKYEHAVELLPELDTKLSKQVQLFMPFINDPNKLINLDDEKRNGVMKVYEYFKKLKEERAQFETILDDCNLMFRVRKKSKKHIVVQKMLHEAVKISSRFANKKVLEALKGPVVIREDLSEKTFVFGAV